MKKPNAVSDALNIARGIARKGYADEGFVDPVDAINQPYVDPMGGVYGGTQGAEAPQWYDKVSDIVAKAGQTVGSPVISGLRGAGEAMNKAIYDQPLGYTEKEKAAFPAFTQATEEYYKPVQQFGRVLMSPFAGAVGGAGEFVREGATQLGADPELARQLGREAAGMTEWSMMRGDVVKPQAPKDVSAIPRSGEVLPPERLALTREPVRPTIVDSDIIAGEITQAKPKESGYVTEQDGPFYRVTPRNFAETEAGYRGSGEPVGGKGFGATGTDGGGPRQAGLRTPEPLSDDALQAIIKNTEQNQPIQVASKYTQDLFGRPFEPVEMPPSSLTKQSAIGRVHEEAAKDAPEYKEAVFQSYVQQLPELIEQTGARNYDELRQAAYEALARETDAQFRTLPVQFSYHRAGEGNYANSTDMARDVHGNKHLYVFQGGEPHDFLNAVDPETGLNANEKFRAVHDYFGHAAYGNKFGAKGEETAWGLHKQMYSPLAQLAMTAETRGQNSFVNYTPINAELVATINEIERLRDRAESSGNKELAAKIAEDKKNAYNSFQFAPQKSVLLPPEFLRTDYTGGVPDAVAQFIQPLEGTYKEAPLTHFSTVEGLTELDPKMYGTGVIGEERSRLRSVPGGVPERTYFYVGEPSSVRREQGIGPHAYTAQGQKLYDITEDPLKLSTLATEMNRRPWSSNFNPGIIDQAQARNDLERIIKEYGYEGLINRSSSWPMAIRFAPTKVEPAGKFNHGGDVREHHAKGEAAGEVSQVTPEEYYRDFISNLKFKETSEPLDTGPRRGPVDVPAFQEPPLISPSMQMKGNVGSFSTNTQAGPFSGGALMSGQEGATPSVGGRFTAALPDDYSATFVRTRPMDIKGGMATTDVMSLAKQINNDQSLGVQRVKTGPDGLPSYSVQYEKQFEYGRPYNTKGDRKGNVGHAYIDVGSTPKTPEKHIMGGVKFKFAEGGDVKAYPMRPHKDWREHKDYPHTGGKIVHMTPDEFIKKANQLHMDNDDHELVDHFQKHIEDGKQLDPLALYPDGHQDGRHRAHAAKKLGIRKIPVIIWPDGKK
jgi:hypothetical protein